MDEYISREAAVDAGYLSDWYISSVGNEPPVWTDAHIDELLNDFIVIPKDTKAADVQPVKQWVKLHDKHPDTEGSYLVCDQYGECEVAKYIPCIKSWFTHKVNGEIRYWTPLPDSPQD